MSDPIKNLTKLLARLPGLGEKSGARLAYFLWRSSGQYAEELARAIVAVKEQVKPCPQCQNPTTQASCNICSDPDRDQGVILVVEEPQDLSAIEKTGAYQGLYHVLGGRLSPLAGRGPESTNAKLLFERVKKGGVSEIVLALNPSAEGDATAAWLEEEISGMEVDLRISRLARGMPVNSEIKYLDPVSLEHSLKGRK